MSNPKSNELISINRTKPTGTFHLLWYPSKRCNYNCSYCSDFLHDNTSKILTEEKFKIAVNNLLKVNFNRVRLTISGGEPLLHPNLVSFCRQVLEKSFFKLTIGVTSNASLPESKYIELSEFLSSMTFSAHLEYLVIDDFLKKILKIKTAIDSKINLRVNLMFVPGKLEMVKKLHRQLMENDIEVIVRRVRARNEYESLEYSDFELDYLLSTYDQKNESGLLDTETVFDGKVKADRISGNEITARNLNNFQGWECKAGADYFTVWNDGTVYPCEPNMKLKPRLGSFYDPDFQWPSEKSSICPVSKCVCLGDIQIPKWKNKF